MDKQKAASEYIPEVEYGGTTPGQYNWLYQALKEQYPDWSEDQLLRGAYSDYFTERDAEQKSRKLQDEMAKDSLIQTGASAVGSALTAALLGML